MTNSFLTGLGVALFVGSIFAKNKELAGIGIGIIIISVFL
jgi:hypothetical protein